MIGQNNLIQKIDSIISSGTYPRFSILEGVAGSGRKTLAKYIGKQLRATTILAPDLSIDSIRKIIQDSYKNVNTCCYIFPEADKMSIQAKNALLKITEEAPNNVYIIMTLEDIYSMLETIRSRACIFKLAPYSKRELRQYIECMEVSEELKEVVTDLNDTPGQLLEMLDTDVEGLISFTEKVYNNIAQVSGSNAFKIGQSFKLKSSDTGYDLKMFLRVFLKTCETNLLEAVKAQDLDSMEQISLAIKITGHCLSDLMNIKGVNAKMVFDSWILGIREAWLE